MKNKKNQVLINCFIWLFLCCYFMQLFNFPNSLTIFIGGVLCLIMAIRQKSIRLDIETMLLFIFMLSYFLIMHGSRAFSMSLTYVGMLIFVIGHYLTHEINHQMVESEKSYMALLFTIVVGYSIHGIINSCLFIDGQFQDPSMRLWMDIWEKWYMPGTWQVIFFLPALSFIFPSLIYFKNRKITSLAVLVTSTLFIYITLASKTRTPILAFPIVFCTQILMYVMLSGNRVMNLAKDKRIHKIAIVVVVLLVVAIALLKDHPLVSSFISIMGRDGGIFNNIRFKIQREGLKQLFQYPMGGNQMYFLGYAHALNTWIDIADAAGLIPFFFFAVYTFYTIYELIKWLLKKEISVERKLMVVGLYEIFFLYYTVERAFGGSVHYMTPWFFINAMVHGELMILKQKKMNNK